MWGVFSYFLLAFCPVRKKSNWREVLPWDTKFSSWWLCGEYQSTLPQSLGLSDYPFFCDYPSLLCIYMALYNIQRWQPRSHFIPVQLPYWERHFYRDLSQSQSCMSFGIFIFIFSEVYGQRFFLLVAESFHFPNGSLWLLGWAESQASGFWRPMEAWWGDWGLVFTDTLTRL